MYGVGNIGVWSLWLRLVSCSLFLLLHFALMAQPAISPPTSNEAKLFLRSWNLRDSLQARKNFIRLLERKPAEAAFYRETGESLLLREPGRTELRRPSVEQLLRLYAASATFLSSQGDQTGADQIRQQELGLLLRYENWFGRQLGERLTTLLEVSPTALPLSMLEVIADRALSKASPARSGPAMGLVTVWTRLQKAWWVMRVAGTASQTDLLEQQSRLRQQFRSRVGDCSRLTASLKGRLPAASDTLRLQQLLAWMALQDCRDRALWDSLAARLLPETRDPWWWRLEARQQLDREDPVRARRAWDQARTLEPKAALQAADALEAGRALALLGLYPEARNSIEQAIRLAPAWGPPYLELARVFVAGAQGCGFTPFQQKTVYWLALDLCRKAAGVDPGVEAAASRLQYRYRQALPGFEELKFYKLAPGDSWALDCWMDTVTTVKTP